MLAASVVELDARMHERPEEQTTSEHTARLLSAVRAKEPGSERDLVLRFQEPLRRLVSGRLPVGLRATLDADDIVQETWSRAFSKLGTFEWRGIGSFWCWLRRIAVNELAMQNRARGALRAGDPGSLPDSAMVPADTAAGPQTAAALRDEHARVEQALDELGEREREAVLLRIELDLPFEDIARECRFVSADAARMAVTRGIQRIAARIRPFG